MHEMWMNEKNPIKNFQTFSLKKGPGLNIFCGRNKYLVPRNSDSYNESFQVSVLIGEFYDSCQSWSDFDVKYWLLLLKH